MDAAEYFNNVRAAAEDIGRLRVRLNMAKARTNAGYGSPSSGMPHGSGTSDPTQQRAVSVVTAEEEMENGIRELSAVIDDGLKVSNGVGKALGQEYAQVLDLRYVDGLKWDSIAHSLSVSVRHAQRIHGLAIDYVNAVGIGGAKAAMPWPCAI